MIRTDRLSRSMGCSATTFHMANECPRVEPLSVGCLVRRAYRPFARSGLPHPRLLPAISLLESTCGSYGRMNNHWGWNGTHGAFDSVPAGIAFVTSRLAEGGPYRDKSLDDKLFAYNQGSSYARKVKHLMTEIETEPPAGGANSQANADSPPDK